MTQNRERGAAGRLYGLMVGRGVARLLEAKRLSPNSNEVVWQGKRAVIKACAPANDSFGVTVAMLPRLDVRLGAFEDDCAAFQIWELDPRKFETAMRDSRSRANGDKVKLVRKAFALTEGRLIARFKRAQVEASA